MLLTRTDYKIAVRNKLLDTKQEIKTHFDKIKEALIANKECQEMIACAQIQLAAIDSINTALNKLDRNF